jgi:hypothetical protein
VDTLRDQSNGKALESNMHRIGKALLEMDPSQKPNSKDKRAKIKALKALLENTIKSISREMESRQEETDTSVQVDTLTGEHDASVQVETLAFATQAAASLGSVAPTISVGSADEDSSISMLTREDIYLQELIKAIQDSQKSLNALQDVLKQDPKSSSYDSVVSYPDSFTLVEQQHHNRELQF